MPGFSMNADGCSAEKCPPEEELSKLRWTAIAMASTGAVLLWLALSMWPVLPELDWMIARMLQGLVSLGSTFLCFSDTQGDVGEGSLEVVGLFSAILAGGGWLLSNFGALRTWWKENQAPQFLKVHVPLALLLLDCYLRLWTLGS